MARKLSEGRTEVVVRKARASDKQPLMRFVKRIWRGHDYIPFVWDRWLKDPSGQMFVAEVGGAPVGMNRVKLVEDGSAWFEGARVHPSYRGRGVATALGENSAKYARERGARTYRLASRSNNWPAHRQVARMGFTEKTRVSVYERASTSKFGRQEGVRSASARDLPLLAEQVERSREYARMSGLVCSSFTCLSLSRELLASRVESGDVLVTEGAAAIVKGGREGRERWKEVCFITGRANPAMRLVKQVVGAKPKRLDTIVFLPVGSRLAAPVKEIGFTRSTSLIVFERKAANG